MRVFTAATTLGDASNSRGNGSSKTATSACRASSGKTNSVWRVTLIPTSHLRSDKPEACLLRPPSEGPGGAETAPEHLPIGPHCTGVMAQRGVRLVFDEAPGDSPGGRSSHGRRYPRHSSNR